MCRMLIRWVAFFSILAVAAFGAYHAGVQHGCETAKIEDSFADGFLTGERHRRFLNIQWDLFLYDRCSKLADGINDRRSKAFEFPKDFLDELRMSITFRMKSERVTADEVLDAGEFSEPPPHRDYQKILSDAEAPSDEIIPAPANVSRGRDDIVPSISSLTGKGKLPENPCN